MANQIGKWAVASRQDTNDGLSVGARLAAPKYGQGKPCPYTPIRRLGLFVTLAVLIFGITAVSLAAPSGNVRVPRERLDAAYQPRRLALVIGINEFKDANWRPLHYAEKDAKDLAKALRDPKVGYFNQVTELTVPEDTSLPAIRKALLELENQNMSPDDVVMIYVSTHGTLEKDSSQRLHQYLVASDTRFDNIAATALEVSELQGWFNRLRSRRKVLIMACCHSGAGKSELPPDVMDQLSHMKGGFFVKPVETASEASVVIGVCAWGETAQEDPAFQNDIYTHFFIEGMTKYDRNQDGAVSISEAHDYAQRQTYYYTHGQQRPFARSDILGADPIILTGSVKGQGKPVVYGYGEGLVGSRLRVNGEEKGALPDGYTTNPGWVRMEAFYGEPGRTDREGSARVNLGRLYVRPGERVDLDRVAAIRAEPPLGLTYGFRTSSSQTLAAEVLPDLPLYGLSYQLAPFPFANTATRFALTAGQVQWKADTTAGRHVNVSATAIDANLSLLYSYQTNSTTFFAGPLIGGLVLQKDLAAPTGNDSRVSATFYPGLILGLRFRLGRNLRLELADQASYQFFNVNDQGQGALVNQITASIYLGGPTFLSRINR